MSPGPDSPLGQLSLAAVILNVFLEQLGLPLPAAPTLMIGSALAADHLGLVTELFLLALIACVLADVIWFAGGRRYGGRVLSLVCRISLSPDSCVRQSQGRFERWGGKVLVVAKFVPGLSLIATPLAGALRMGWAVFLGLSVLGSALWVGVFVVCGALLNAQIRQILPRIVSLGAQALLLLALLLGAYIGLKWWQRRRFYSMLRMARIGAAELHLLMDGEPPPIILDVRSASARALDPRWIPGALHVPVDEAGPPLRGLARDREVVVYCTCPNEASAARVAKLLITHGFARVRPLEGGLDAWVAAGYPTGEPTEPPLHRAA